MRKYKEFFQDFRFLKYENLLILESFLEYQKFSRGGFSLFFELWMKSARGSPIYY